MPFGCRHTISVLKPEAAFSLIHVSTGSNEPESTRLVLGERRQAVETRGSRRCEARSTLLLAAGLG
jgi:hypothetical protein